MECIMYLILVSALYENPLLFMQDYTNTEVHVLGKTWITRILIVYMVYYYSIDFEYSKENVRSPNLLESLFHKCHIDNSTH